jgi:hypothetical protein
MREEGRGEERRTKTEQMRGVDLDAAGEGVRRGERREKKE